MFSMYLKKAAPLLVVLAVAVAALNFGTYDPYNELSSLAPIEVQADDAVSLGLTIPTLSVGGVTVPSLSTTVSSVAVTETTVSAPTLGSTVTSESTATESVGTVPTVTAPVVTTGGVTFPEINLPGLTVPTVTVPTASAPSFGSTTGSGTTSFTSCDITASEATVTSGSSVTLTWETSGFAEVTINGVTMSGVDGSYTYTNIQANTTYILTAKTADGRSECTTSVTVLCLTPIVAPTCTERGFDFTVAKYTWNGTSYVQNTLRSGFSATVTGNATDAAWTSSPAAAGVIAATAQASRTYSGGTSGTVSKCEIGTGCHGILTLELCGNDTTTPPAPTCTLNSASSLLTTGSSTTLTWSTTNAASVSLTDFGTVGFSGSTSTPALTASKTYALDVLGTNGQTVQCLAAITVVTTPPPVVPRCTAFTATPTSIVRGNAAVLNWSTENGTRVVINNAIGEVAASGTLSVSPLATTEYLLTVFDAANNEDTCSTVVTVTTTPTPELPRCEYITATPTSLPVGGGTAVLSWNTANATNVSIAPVVGVVGAFGSSTVSVTATTNFVLTATDGTNQVTCAVNVPVATTPTPTPLSCSANATFTASPTTINRGDAATLTWTTTGVTGVSFDNGITATGLSGSTTVMPTDATTYTMTITNGSTTAACPVTVAVSTSGGGGGGSSTPRCELSVSDNKISLGDSVKLVWDSSRATSLVLEDETADDVLITTEGLTTAAKERLYDGTLTVSPKKDTTYVLTVKRGTKTRSCSVEVEIENTVVVKEVRDQQPLVSGIALTSVPYTGFEAGPILTLMFYMLLMAWALYIAYLLVIRRDVLGGISLASSAPTPTPTPIPKNLGEAVRPEVFVAQVTTPTPTAVPVNLPVASNVGYGALEQAAVVSKNVHNIDDVTMTAIENHAHGKKVLLSSDAIRHFVATTTSEAERIIALDEVIKAAKAQFPAEDGWIVINEKRMQDLCATCAVNQISSSAAPYVPAIIPEGAGSLAEAIVTGNVVAAYELIGNRPMFALADAAADLDAVYRLRRGEVGVASELLMKETAQFTEVKILAMIQALTGALDGTYTDEASAVKMAIMKAIKAAA